MKIVIYVDGFNLYYGAVKNTPYKWLDIGRMSRLLFSRHEIRKIKYFTALLRTDVSLASHLINDGHNGEYELAVVVSNDSDLVEPIRMVVGELRLPVIIVSPYEENSFQLKKYASSVRHIRKGLLRESQFPDKMSDDNGSFKKPVSW